MTVPELIPLIFAFIVACRAVISIVRPPLVIPRPVAPPFDADEAAEHQAWLRHRAAQRRPYGLS